MGAEGRKPGPPSEFEHSLAIGLEFQVQLAAVDLTFESMGHETYLSFPPLAVRMSVREETG